MKKNIMIGVAVVIAIIAIGVAGFIWYARSQVATYQNFGVSFKYPKDMQFEEQGMSGFEAEEAGNLLFEKPGVSILVSWMPTEEANRESLVQLIAHYIEKQKQSLGFKPNAIVQPDQVFFPGEVYQFTQGEYDILATRFFTAPERVGSWLNFVGAWHLPESKQTILVGTAVELDEHPGFLYSSNYQGINWPEYKRDPSVKLLNMIIRSFKYIATKLPSDDRQWIELLALQEQTEQDQTYEFDLKTGKIQVHYTLKGEKIVDGALNKTNIVILKTGLSLEEAFKKGQENINIASAKSVSGSGSNTYSDTVEPGRYKLVVVSPAEATWSITIKEKR